MKPRKSILNLAMALAITVTSMAHAKTEAVPGVVEQPQSYFYTGKPYDEDLDTYSFAYRNYDPKTTRWTVADPSGFPDGANNLSYIHAPTSQLDPTGLSATDSFSNQVHNVSFVLSIIDPGSGVGPRINSTIANGWDQAIESTWNHTGIDRSNGQRLTFTLTVTTGYYAGPVSPSQVPGNVITVQAPSFRSNVIDGNQGNWASDSSGLTIAHEAGHIMGASDQYTDNSAGISIPHAGWEHTLMGYGEAPTTKDWNLVLGALGQTVHLFE